MRSLKYGMLTLALASAVAMPFEAFAQFDYRQNLPYRDGYRREVRGPVYFSEGDRLPARYLQGEFVVRDWWGNNLKRPPRGAQWVRVNNQFLMISLNNGTVKKVVRIEDRNDRDWGGPDRWRGTPDFPDRGPPPRIHDRADQEARWQQRYHRSFAYNDDSFYRECQNKPDAAGVVIGAVLGGLLGNAAGGRNDSGLATVAGVIAGGAIAASITSKLDCDDRAYAYRTYTDGFNAGRENTRYEWRNPRNDNRGEFIINDYYDDPDGFRCAEYTQKIYIAGRQQEGRGRACRQPDGAWAMID